MYIVTNKKFGTLYVGITDNLIRRIYEHKHDLAVGFTSKFKLHILVYYEIFHDPLTAINREKNIKAWKRNWKINKIIEHNPQWDDLYSQLL